MKLGIPNSLTYARDVESANDAHPPPRIERRLEYINCPL